jgi:hypothetical protein
LLDHEPCLFWEGRTDRPSTLLPPQPAPRKAPGVRRISGRRNLLPRKSRRTPPPQSLLSSPQSSCAASMAGGNRHFMAILRLGGLGRQDTRRRGRVQHRLMGPPVYRARGGRRQGLARLCFPAELCGKAVRPTV